MSFLILGEVLRSQSLYEARGFSANDGMCAESFNSITGDDKGFLWMTSENGIVRYDGNAFFCFHHDDSDPNSLLANKCDYVYRDVRGRIWVKTLYGLSLYDEANNHFFNYPAPPGILSGLAGGKITEDHRGRLWLGGYGEVIIFDPVTLKYEKSGWFQFAKETGIIQNDKRNNAVLEVMRKNEHELYLLSVFGLFSVNTQTGKFLYHPNPYTEDSWAFYLCTIDKEGLLWIGTYDQCFYLYNPGTGQWQHKNCGNGNLQIVTDIVPLGKDSLLLLSEKKLVVFRPSLSTFSNLDFEMSGSNAGAKLGHFWKAHVSNGKINLLMSGSLPFLQLRKPRHQISETKLKLPNGFSNNVAHHTGMDEKVLIGDWERQEILLYDFKTRSYQYLILPKKGTKTGVLQSFFNIGANKGILVTSDQIFSLNIKDGILTPILCASYQNAAKAEFRNVVKDEKGTLYVRERSTGIWKLNATASRIEPFFSPNTRGNFSDLYFEPVTRKFWLSQERNGVFIVDPVGLGSKHYPLKVDAMAGASTINSIVGNGRGKVFLALLDHGLMEVDAPAMLVKRYTQLQGLPSDNVSFGLVDESGNYWGTSQMGLYCLQNGKISNYAYHSLGKNFFHRLSSNGKGSFFQNLHPSSLLSFSPKTLLSSGEDGELYLAEIRLFGRPILKEELLHLSPTQNSLSFRFGCQLDNDWRSPECEYSLNQSIWQPFKLKDELNLFNLSPGDYRIQIRRSDRDVKTLDLFFSIASPWYMMKSLWFLLAIVLIILVYILYTYRINMIREQEEVKSKMAQQLSQMEMAALRAQMNPHFIFNCLNSINRFILTNEADLASDYLTQFSRLIRIVLDNSREEIIPLENELSALKLYLAMEAMRFHNRFNWAIDVGDGIDTNAWYIAPMTMQPYVENAIWHGLLPLENSKGIKKLVITIRAFGSHGILISIDDNGVGRKTDENGKDNTRKSHGMALTAERMALISRLTNVKTEIEIIDKLDSEGQAAGTTINIVLNKDEDPLT